MKPVTYLKLMAGCVVFAGSALVSTQVQAHGGLSMAEDMCKLTVGPYMMHFSGYQPGNTQEKQFCEDIPATGQTIVVLDYIEQELRSLPTEVRIIRDTGSEQNLDADTVLHLPAKVYPSGSVDFTYTFDKPGKFVGLVTVGEQQKQSASRSLGRNISIQFTWSRFSRSSLSWPLSFSFAIAENHLKLPLLDLCGTGGSCARRAVC
jgi:hypothetical protein